MKVVLDVNVWISGLLWGGVPGKILKLAKNQKITIFASQKILADIEDTLERWIYNCIPDDYRSRTYTTLC